ncbi:hypothetical protein [Streptomyces paradoxus]|jgi:hypothetical protein|uniref:hypothetical protein n=1 Tax=Streptomyces paradoxus TaxID=66375 RepID=UPI0037D4210F
MPSIESRFRQFHRDNPHVLSEMERLAKQWFESGKTSLGVQLLFEVMRWDRSIKTKSSDEFKVNNDFAAHYARMMIARNPSWAGRIRVRALRSA